MSATRTFTFVVRVPEDLPVDSDRDPRLLLTDDEVMFWAAEDGVTGHALDLGADPDLWADDDAEVDSAIGQREVCSRCDLEVEWTGNHWWDRGGNAECPVGYAHLVTLDCGHRLLPRLGYNGLIAVTTPSGARVCHRSACYRKVANR